MSLSKEQIMSIEGVLKNSLRSKIKNYKPETSAMPFHTRLLGKDRMALFSFVQSLNTNFGTSIFEPVAVSLAKNYFEEVQPHATAGEHISEEASIEIQKIMDDLTTGRTLPDKKSEIDSIRKVCQKGRMIKVKPTKVDVLVKDKSGNLYLFDIKTAKPNAGGFKEFKRTLLEWVATVLANDPNTKINTLIAIPYNPYEPKPYARWTIRGMLDLKCELKVAEEFWDFLGGQDTYKDLLDCFEHVGIEMRDELNNYFEKFKKTV